MSTGLNVHLLEDSIVEYEHQQAVERREWRSANRSSIQTVRTKLLANRWDPDQPGVALDLIPEDLRRDFPKADGPLIPSEPQS
jgi:hypothetical protein